jgi:hypothetical protein
VNTKTCLLGFFIHQIDAPKFLLISLSVVTEKRHRAMQKLFKKKEKKKRVEKNGQVSEIYKTMGT